MKLLFVSTGVFPDVVGGMERHSRFLVPSLAQLGVEIDLIHTTEGAAYFADLGVGNRFVRWPAYRFPYHYIAEYYAFSRSVARFIEMQGHAFDVIYGQGYGLWAYLRERRVPCVFHPHGLNPFQAVGLKQTLGSFPLRRLAQYEVRHCDGVVSLGGNITRILRDRCKASPDRIFEIPNAVDPDRIDAQSPKDEIRIPRSMLLVGRMVAGKGVEVALEAVRRIPDRDLKLFVIGDGPLLPSLRQRCRDPRIQFMGPVTDDRELFRWMARVELLVSSSFTEGMPTSILEAMSARLPIIATDVGAVREVVGSGSGRLIRPGDAASLAHEMTAMLSLPPAERRRIGERGRLAVQRRFTWSRVARLTLETLERVVSLGPRR